ncbi:SH3 domain-binding glutamic acid-rich-like protein 3 [Peromyscus maniculatus bairdii]|uniref:SH3 domain-binding glutamic acid-rich-like protein 3 n=1 Tax=Peromyscus maniculatus bairdii TaxID=230844 RepID=A0A8C8UFN2_PERMB|nr:SH3 domain-binding glutamic acid-rich-like protein 3 [Peromyscus maniculatus bairdii]
MSNIKIYYTSVSCSREVKQRQNEVMRILDTYKVKYELIDIAVSSQVLEEMRTKVASPKAAPPQIFNGQEYCGDFMTFHDAKENKEILKFLKMEKMDNFDKW